MSKLRALYNRHLALSTGFRYGIEGWCNAGLPSLLFLQTSCKIMFSRYGKVRRNQEACMAAKDNQQERAQNVKRVDACEVVVVGAGLVGAAVVASLAAEGLDVGVLEARNIASGATGHTAGLILTGLPTFYAQAVEQYGREMAQAVWKLTLNNRASLISAADGLDVELARPGSLLLAADDEEAALLQTSAEMLEADGFEVHFEDEDPLERGFAAALNYPDDVVVDTETLAKRMLQSYDVPVHTGTEVYGLKQEGDDILVLARGRMVRATTVVLAVNAYASLIDDYFSDKVAPIRGYTLVTQPLGAGLIPIPGSTGPFFFRQAQDGGLLFSAWSTQYETPAAGPSDESAEVDLMRFVGCHFPEATNQFVQRESSVMGISRDGVPLIGALPHLPQVFFAVGFAGSGLSLAFAAADLLAGLIVRGAEPELLSARRLE
jgi:gamma-glutamylputrescine oxidase